MTKLVYIPSRIIDHNGIADGATVYVYLAGTTTPVNIYSDAGMTIPMANPFVIAAGAFFPAVYYDSSVSIKLTVVSALDGSSTSDDPYNPNSLLASASIGGGTLLTKAVVYTPTLTPSSVAAATVAEQTFTVTGLTTADKVYINPPVISNATGIAGVRVSAADTLAIRFVNPTAGALTPTAGVYTLLAFRS